jgi:hypothetical protein
MSVRQELLSFRVGLSLAKKLAESAKADGRSLSEEIRFRLELSFDREATVRAVLDEEMRRAEQDVERGMRRIQEMVALYEHIPEGGMN